MVSFRFLPQFKRSLSKVQNKAFKQQVKKQIAKLQANPTLGKPMRYERKGTRELYVRPFRLSYSYDESANLVTLLDLYHKDEQ